jgi:hypothetical protein
LGGLEYPDTPAVGTVEGVVLPDGHLDVDGGGDGLGDG